MVKEIINKIKLNLKLLVGNKETKAKAKKTLGELHYNKHGFPMYRPLIEEENKSNKRNQKY